MDGRRNGPGEPAPGDDADWERIPEELALAARGVAPDSVPERLCEACVRLLPATGASISMKSQKGIRVTLCASDRVSAHLAEVQDTLGDGPCIEAGTLVAPVFAPDLTASADARRWPLFVPQALEAGAEAVFSFPLALAGTAVGSLDLYRQRAGPLGERDVRTALYIADALTLSVLALPDRHPTREDGGVPWLTGAEANREEIYQATGMLMVQLGVSAAEALSRLRGRAFSQGRTITQVAKDVVERVGDGFDGDD
ncbi:GAF and ANTAR domain-containing protein [Streptomyces winkii]|uniref:GAF and ANTAR domain-containing protein n=1 Tax=Streptomyces winkii TaxID=3051178 RepID=UPI0028D1A232|nr:GAF and ANTAR domain-containing protein [Streptomyces sp. DSM 40971]